MSELPEQLEAVVEGAVPAAALADRRDVALLAQIVAGNRAAFDTLYRNYFARLTDFVARILHQRELAEEVVNDTMYAVWTGGARYAGRSRVSTWIFGIAYHKALKRLERERRTAADALDEDFDLATDADPGNDADAARLRRQLEAALAKLSPAHRSVVELTFLLEYSYEEAADIVGCPVNTVKTRMFHARARLRKLLSTVVSRAK
jgi:RNA polymerase sigma-70 factor (ECF subfamily)